jgi:ATP-dependent DNA helicase RecG
LGASQKGWGFALYSLDVNLSTPMKFVKRVGERVAADLAKRGVETVEDLLYHLPFRYEDRLNIQPIASLQANTMASVIGEVRGSSLLETRTGPLFELTVGQGVHSVKAMWFRGSYLQGKFQVGQMVALYGKLEASRSNAGKFKLIQPQFEILPVPGASGSGGADAEFALLEMGRIVPIYETLGGTTPWGAKLGSKWVRRLLWSIFEELIENDVKADETIPPALSRRLGLPTRMEALRAIHFPEAGTPMQELMSFQTPAHRRLIFEEFFYLELGLELKRRKLREREGTAFTTGPEVREALKQMLPFHPTAAQKRVLAEIVADMRKTRPMRRLLQGDVGSGKTIVALQAAVVAIENGYQAAMMVPTEILATQHYLSARKLLGEKVSPRTGRSYKVTLLTGSLKEEMKREGRGRVLRGESNLVIGTHALQEDKVDFHNLGLVIVDEQHRFGVQQRFRLMKKPGPDGRVTDPDVLVMTATPIPRTLALTLYGDLDASVIDELPPGRTPIVTRRTTEERAPDVWEFVRKQVAQGHQAYLVYPVIEGAKDDQPELDFAHDAEPEPVVKKKAAKKKAVQTSFPKQPLRSATASYEELRHGALAGLRLGLLHGKLSADEKEVTMARFKRGEIDVLVATTVIEVGVDVPNASVMVIEHAERFGLAQMHQLRGRVGRGAAKSYCLLVTGPHVSPEANERLDAMVRTQNGFELAELDLQQRGPGEFFGTRQAGMPEFRVANLLRDQAMLEMAKSEAMKFASAPEVGISVEEIDGVWKRLREQWQRRYGLVEA